MNQSVFTQPGSLAEQVDQHVADVETIRAESGSASPAWDAVARAWQAIRIDVAAANQRLATAIAAGAEPAEVERLATEAAVARDSGGVGDLRKSVARAAGAALLTAYASTARENYSTIASAFDTAAGSLAKCAAAAPINEGAESVVGVPAKVGQAWLDAATHGKELDRLLPLLVLAAELTRAIPADDKAAAEADAAPNDWHLALCCDPGTVHRRRVWQAWEAAGGRLGRWGALLALGVTIRAADLGAYAVYARPRPIEVQTERVHLGAGIVGLRQTPIDPEDVQVAK